MSVTITQPQLIVSVQSPETLSVSIAPVTVPALAVTISPVLLQVGAGQGSSGRVVGETPSGTLNGSNAQFLALSDFVPESLEVFIGGHRLTLLEDYTTSGHRSISLTASPLPGENLRINYQQFT